MNFFLIHLTLNDIPHIFSLYMDSQSIITGCDIQSCLQWYNVGHASSYKRRSLEILGERWMGDINDVIAWKRFPHYWPLVRGIRQSRVDSPHKGTVLESFNAFSESRFAPSQWETALQSNDVSHWLGANLDSALSLLWCTVPCDIVSKSTFTGGGQCLCTSVHCGQLRWV